MKNKVFTVEFSLQQFSDDVFIGEERYDYHIDAESADEALSLAGRLIEAKFKRLKAEVPNDNRVFLIENVYYNPVESARKNFTYKSHSIRLITGMSYMSLMTLVRMITPFLIYAVISSYFSNSEYEDTFLYCIAALFSGVGMGSMQEFLNKKEKIVLSIIYTLMILSILVWRILHHVV